MPSTYLRLKRTSYGPLAYFLDTSSGRVARLAAADRFLPIAGSGELTELAMPVRRQVLQIIEQL